MGVANIEHLTGAIFSDTVLSLVFSGMLALFSTGRQQSQAVAVQSRVLQFFRIRQLQPLSISVVDRRPL